MKIRIAIITNILPPYRVPLFNYLAEQPNVKLRVFLCAETEPDRHWNWPSNIQFEYEIDGSPSYRLLNGKPTYLPFGLIERIHRFRPDVIIVGSLGVVGLICWFGSKLLGVPLLLWSEATAISEKYRNRYLTSLRRFLVRNSQAYIGVSSAAAEYFVALGAYSKKVQVSLQTLDVEFFGQQVEKYRKEKENIKKDLGLKGRIIAYVGNLEFYKGSDLLLDAYFEVLKHVPNINLLLVGTGSLFTQMKNKTTQAVNARVHFIGFKQHQELPLYYAISDLFCLFSRYETFGIVVTEAIAAGLPVVCSQFAGASFDLVQNGYNGYVINPFNIENSANRIILILKNDALRFQMGKKSIELAKKCTIESAASAMLTSVYNSLKL